MNEEVEAALKKIMDAFEEATFGMVVSDIQQVGRLVQESIKLKLQELDEEFSDELS